MLENGLKIGWSGEGQRVMISCDCWGAEEQWWVMGRGEGVCEGVRWVVW